MKQNYLQYINQKKDYGINPTHSLSLIYSVSCFFNLYTSQLEAQDDKMEKSININCYRIFTNWGMSACLNLQLCIMHTSA